MSPAPTRLAGYRRVERRGGLPLPLKAFLAVAVAALGGAMLWVSAGAVGPAIASIVKGVGGIVSEVGAVATSPSPTAVPVIPDAPGIDPPENPYTNREAVDLTVNVPSSVTGRADHTLRLYVTLPDQEPALVREESVGATSVQLLPGVALVAGRNDFQAAIFGPGGESERSEIATWILDQSKPKVNVISPKDGAQVKKPVITVKGKSQAGAEIRIQNAGNGAVATTVAGSDGLWETQLAVADGQNPLTVTATDPAGNENTRELTVRKGSGRLTAELTTSGARFKASRLPRTITLTVVVTDPNGLRLGGAVVLFMVMVPGLEPIASSEIRTDGNGVAAFQTTIPAGAMPGSGLAQVLVTSADGEASDRQVVTIVE